MCFWSQSQTSLSQNSEIIETQVESLHHCHYIKPVKPHVKKEQCLRSQKKSQVMTEQAEVLRGVAVECGVVQRAEVQRCGEVRVRIKGQYISIMHTIFSSASMMRKSKVTERAYSHSLSRWATCCFTLWEQQPPVDAQVSWRGACMYIRRATFSAEIPFSF